MWRSGRRTATFTMPPFVALGLQGRRRAPRANGWAAAAFQLAIHSGHADEAPKAAVQLGVLRAGQGDPVGAARAFQLAIDSGRAEAPKAAVQLGVLRAGQGDPAEAAAAYQLAIDSGHADQAPYAA